MDFDQNTGISSVVGSVRKEASGKLQAISVSPSAQGVKRPDGKCEVNISGTLRLNGPIKYGKLKYRIDEACHVTLVGEWYAAESPRRLESARPPFRSESRSSSLAALPRALERAKANNTCTLHVLAEQDAPEQRYILAEVINDTSWSWDWGTITGGSFTGTLQTYWQGWNLNGDPALDTNWVEEPVTAYTAVTGSFYCENNYWCPNGRDYDITLYGRNVVSGYGDCNGAFSSRGVLPPNSYVTSYSNQGPAKPEAGRE